MVAQLNRRSSAELWRRVGVWVAVGMLFLLVRSVAAGTRPEEVKALEAFKAGVKNPAALDWPEGSDPCDDGWPHITCGKDPATKERYINSILVQDLGLGGDLPKGLGALKNVRALYMGGNFFTGAVPDDIGGLVTLEQIGLDNNQLESVPKGLFTKMTNLQRLYMLANQFNGQPLPDLSACLNLQVVDFTAAGFGGTFPTYISTLTALVNLSLALNNLEGQLPDDAFQPLQASLNQVFLNNNKFSGRIPNAVGQLPLLTKLWLHGNQFTGPIPATLGGSFSLLRSIRLNSNALSGILPASLGQSPVLGELNVADNQLRGELPTYMVKFGAGSYRGNGFCSTTPGKPCSQVTDALLQFLGDVGYPQNLLATWTGNNPCSPPWLGIGCDNTGNVVTLTLANQKLTGQLSNALAGISTLRLLQLPNNNLSGPVPASLTEMPRLKVVNIENNRFTGVLPKFAAGVEVMASGNLLADANPPKPKKPVLSPPVVQQPPAAPPKLHFPPPRPVQHPPPPAPAPPIPAALLDVMQSNASSSSSSASPAPSSLPASAVVSLSILLPLLVLAIVAILWMSSRRRKSSRVGHFPSDLPFGKGAFKVGDGSISRASLSVPRGFSSSIHLREAGGMSRATSVAGGDVDSLTIPLEVVRAATNDFAAENVVGKGGFGTVYKGTLDDGTFVAVKRMALGHLTSKGIREFESEITVLSKLRHRHLVNLIGFCIDGYERLLVYEFMAKGALSRHLFDYQRCRLPPLTWQQRVSIALDVARGMEYLHGLAHASFIHRDLKPSNVLLDDGMRAKISDFGLVKPSDGHKSIETRLAGTFGYLAPEYAVTGKVTTKSDVYSFGVILMELVTGRRALDESQSEESVHLATWLPPLISDRSKLGGVIDPALHQELEAIEKGTESDAALLDTSSREARAAELFQSICAVADIALHCSAREPRKRPAMGDVVAMLLPHVQQWRPQDPLQDEAGGIDVGVSLADAIQQWKEMGEEEEVPAYYCPDTSGNLGKSFAGATVGTTSVAGQEDSFVVARSGSLHQSFSSVGSGVRWTNLLEAKQGEVKKAVEGAKEKSPKINQSFYGSGPLGDVEQPVTISIDGEKGAGRSK